MARTNASLRRPAEQQHAIRRRKSRQAQRSVFRHFAQDARTFTATNARSSPTHGRSTTSGQKQTRVSRVRRTSAHLAVLNQIMKKVAAGEKPATEIDQNTGDWIHGFHQFPTAEKGAQGAFITLRRDQDPEPGFVQQNGGTITKEQQEAFLAARQNWLNDFSARVGQDAYAGLSMAALNGGPVAERITALRNSSPAARSLQRDAQHPGVVEDARQRAEGEADRHRQRPEIHAAGTRSGERGWRQAAI